MSNAFDKASLVMLPHAYEEGKVYSLKPTDRSGDFTFSRGTDTATRVGEDGYIKKEYANLLEQSNSFDTTWTNTGTTETGGQSDKDGGTDAWLLESTAAAFDRRINQSVSTSGVHTLSIYAKASASNWMSFYNGTDRVYFDLSNGVVGSSDSGTILHKKIENYGNGWYRCIAVFNRSITYISVIPANGDGNSFVSLGNSIYIQDAMLNQGLVAYPYLETTTAPVYGGLTDDMPRLDYSGGATCPSLLLEPSRTNLIRNSEWLGTGLQNLTVTIDDTISPEGYANVSKITSTTGSSKQTNSSIPFVAGTTYTFSAWIKNIDASTVNIFWYDGTSNNNYFTDDVNTETFTRIQFSFTPVNTTSSGQLQIARDLPDGQSIYVYGAQLEEGSYPTSYIPTYGSSQTRAADFPTTTISTDITDSTQGSVYFEFQSIADNNSLALSYITLNTTTTDNIRFGLTSQGSDIYFRAKKDSVDLFSYNAPLSNPTSVNKMAFRWGLNDWKLYLNGTPIYTNTSVDTFEIGDLTKLESDINGGAYKFLGKIRGLFVFPTKLSDSELEALTQA